MQIMPAPSPAPKDKSHQKKRTPKQKQKDSEFGQPTVYLTQLLFLQGLLFQHGQSMQIMHAAPNPSSKGKKKFTHKKTFLKYGPTAEAKDFKMCSLPCTCCGVWYSNIKAYCSQHSQVHTRIPCSTSENWHFISMQEHFFFNECDHFFHCLSIKWMGDYLKFFSTLVYSPT